MVSGCDEHLALLESKNMTSRCKLQKIICRLAFFSTRTKDIPRTRRESFLYFKGKKPLSPSPTPLDYFVNILRLSVGDIRSREEGPRK
jgi:hypothetical protein